MSDGSEVRQRGIDSSGRPILMSDYLADWFDGYCSELGFAPTVTQGSWMSRVPGGGADDSAGFHDRGGCLDLRVWDRTDTQIRSMVGAARRGGAAAWLRNLEHGGFKDAHVHLVLGDDHDLANGAAWQWLNYTHGGDGLGDGTGKDYHPRPKPLAIKPPDHYLEGLYDMTPDDVRRIVREEVAAGAAANAKAVWTWDGFNNAKDKAKALLLLASGKGTR